MSLEDHRRAMDRFNELERMEPGLRSEVLANEDHAVYHTPCSAGLTAVIFRKLKINREKWHVYWDHLYGRPVARVYNLYRAAQEHEPERYGALFSAFAQRVKPLDAA